MAAKSTREEQRRAIEALGLHWFFFGSGAPTVDAAGKKTLIAMVEREIERARNEAEGGGGGDETS
jgi:hypothetical protein